jgi:uncharacterized integral membrane protein
MARAGEAGDEEPDAAAESAVGDMAPGTAPPVPTSGGEVPATRTARLFVALAVAMAALVVVLVFVLENLRRVEVDFFGARLRLPLGVDLLLAAVLGGLVVFFFGALRIAQLRRLVRGRRAARAGRQSR